LKRRIVDELHRMSLLRLGSAGLLSDENVGGLHATTGSSLVEPVE
jgi:hypothetical protein